MSMWPPHSILANKLQKSKLSNEKESKFQKPIAENNEFIHVYNELLELLVVSGLLFRNNLFLAQ